MPHPKITLYKISVEHGVYAIAGSKLAKGMEKLYPNDEFRTLMIPYTDSKEEQIALLTKAFKNLDELNKLTAPTPQPFI